MRPTEEKIQKDPSDLPIYLFKQGNNCEAYRYFGAHLETRAGESGVVFRVWAPHAAAISVVGDFNSWKPGSHPMRKVDGDSVWELFIPGVKEYDVYKYCVTTRGGDLIYKADPYAFHAETRPSNGSKVYDITGFAWHDDAWQTAQKKADVINGPMNIYEMHAGSWKLKDEKVPYNYSELADELIPYIREMGYTHVELLPVMEYPFDGSWGYQVTGYFAPTSRYGTPKDFMAFVDKMHEAGIGVIMDWVPAHFPKDAFALGRFDGTPLYEYPAAAVGQSEWGSCNFMHSRGEIRCFIQSCADYCYHFTHSALSFAVVFFLAAGFFAAAFFSAAFFAFSASSRRRCIATRSFVRSTPCSALHRSASQLTMRSSKSSPPRRLLPAVASTSMTPSSMSRMDTSKVPPPRS